MQYKQNSDNAGAGADATQGEIHYEFTNTETSSSGSGGSSGGIAPGVAGAIGGVGLFALIVVVVVVRRRQAQAGDEEEIGLKLGAVSKKPTDEWLNPLQVKKRSLAVDNPIYEAVDSLV